MSHPAKHNNTMKDATRRYVDLDELRTFGVDARGECAGKLRDILIEDQQWTAQYLLVDAGGWMPGRLILVPINALDYIDMDRRRVVLGYTRMELRRSIERIAQLSGASQKAAVLRGVSGSQPLWVAVVPAGEAAQPVLTDRSVKVDGLPATPKAPDPRTQRVVLRSAREFLGNQVYRSSNEAIGRVHALAISERDLRVAFVLIRANPQDTDSLLPIPLHAFSAIGWKDKRMAMGGISASIISSLPSVPAAREITSQIEEDVRAPFDPIEKENKNIEARGVH